MRHISLRLLTAFPAAVALAVPMAVWAGPVVSAQAAPAQLPVITTFTPGDFPESLAVDGQGNLYASLGFIGQVVKVTPTGQQQPVASLPVGAGLLTGLAFDPGGNLYVADATFEAAPTPPGCSESAPMAGRRGWPRCPPAAHQRTGGMIGSLTHLIRGA